MASVTGLTAERMIAMENATIIDGDIVGDDLVLVTKGGTPINAGSVRGIQGPSGGAFFICASTTRPATPTDGLAIYETDTKLMRTWTGTRWKLQEQIICTSTTRPVVVAADEGVKIYETDSNMEFIWTGTAWVSPFNALMPVGSEMVWAGQLATIPPLFLPEDGRVLNRVDYLELFTVLGVSWNTGGELGSQFRIPDARDRVVVGAGGAYTPGNYGGENTHALTISEMPAHHHETGGHADAAYGAGIVRTLTAGTGDFTLYTGGPANVPGTVSPHNNMQEFAAKHVIMRVL